MQIIYAKVSSKQNPNPTVHCHSVISSLFPLKNFLKFHQRVFPQHISLVLICALLTCWCRHKCTDATSLTSDQPPLSSNSFSTLTRSTNTDLRHVWKGLCPNTRKRGRKHFLLGFSRKTLNLGKQLNVEFLNMTQRSDVSEQMTVFNETEAIRVSHTDGLIHLKWSSSMLCASGFVCQVSSVCFYVSV